MTERPEPPKPPPGKPKWLTRLVSACRRKDEGDTIAAQVGEGAQNTAAGKNIIQIIGNTLNLPSHLVWSMISGIVLLLLIGLIGLYYLWVTAEGATQTAVFLSNTPTPTLTPIPTPTPTPLRMPEGSFNIAVAELVNLNAGGQPVEGAGEGYARANSISRFVDSQADTLTDILNQDVVVWGPDMGIPIVAPVEAPGVATRLNAQTLIYGELQQVDDSRWDLRPMFYLSDEAVGQAKELVGEYGLGHKITYRPASTAETGDVNETLDIRLRALVQILRGLSYMTGFERGSYESASAVFQETAEQSEWARRGDGTGQEILFLFLGNSYLAQANLTPDSDPIRSDLLVRSRDAFSQSVRLNPAYPRPYNGLGSVYFQMARALESQAECDWDFDLLNQAEAAHSRALAAPDDAKPPSGYVDFRARFGRARVHYWLGYCIDTARWENAQIDYRWVVDAFSALAEPQPYLIDVAAFAHTDLGFMALLQGSSLINAEDETQRGQGEAMLAESVSHYRTVFSLIEQSATAESRKHGRRVMPYYLTALCLAQQGSEALPALDHFLMMLPAPDAARAEILSEVSADLWKECTNETVSSAN